MISRSPSASSAAAGRQDAITSAAAIDSARLTNRSHCKTPHPFCRPASLAVWREMRRNEGVQRQARHPIVATRERKTVSDLRALNCWHGTFDEGRKECHAVVPHFANSAVENCASGYKRKACNSLDDIRRGSHRARAILLRARGIV